MADLDRGNARRRDRVCVRRPAQTEPQRAERVHGEREAAVAEYDGTLGKLCKDGVMKILFCHNV